MNRLLNRVWKLFANTRRPGTSARPRRSYRPLCEALETREVMSTVYLVPAGSHTDASHFNNFDSAYQAAKAGDVIQVKHGASVASVGTDVSGSRVSGGTVNANVITINNARIGAGEWVNVTSSTGQDTVFVEAAQTDGHGNVTLTFNANLTVDHTGAGTTVATLGQLGILKPITLKGDPHHSPAPVTSPIELPSDAAHVSFDNLNFTNAHGLVVDADHQFITVEKSTLPFLGLNIGAGNASDVITGNHLTGATVINGDGAAITADRVTNNTFTGNGNLYMINEADALVSHNVWNVTYQHGDLPAATIFNSPNMLFYGNRFTIHNATSSTTALALSYSAFFPQTTLVDVVNNTFNTGGNGVGLDITGPVDAMIQGCDFRHNSVGVYLYGDGTTVGSVDLGGGAFGSAGGNNFGTFTDAGVASGHFAIVMHNTSAGDTVYALHDTWGSSDAWNLVKDSYAHTNATEAAYNSGTTPGTGDIVTFKLIINPLPVTRSVGLLKLA